MLQRWTHHQPFFHLFYVPTPPYHITSYYINSIVYRIYRMYCVYKRFLIIWNKRPWLRITPYWFAFGRWRKWLHKLGGEYYSCFFLITVHVAQFYILLRFFFLLFVRFLLLLLPPALDMSFFSVFCFTTNRWFIYKFQMIWKNIYFLFLLPQSLRKRQQNKQFINNYSD